LKEEVSVGKMNAFVIAVTAILLSCFSSITTTVRAVEQKINYKNTGAFVTIPSFKTTCVNVESGRVVSSTGTEYKGNIITVMSRGKRELCSTTVVVDIVLGGTHKYRLRQCGYAKVRISGSVRLPKASVTYKRCAPNGVALYENKNYKGTGRWFTEGDYTLDGIKALGLKSDQISSIRVSQGYKVEIFEHNNYGGSAKIITKDNSRLSEIGFNDKISSVKVRKRAGFDIGLYEHCNYEGKGRYFKEGQYLLNAIEASGLENDQISSIEVPQGYQVEIFEHNNYGGSAINITEDTDTSCLYSMGFNDKIGSVKVRKL